MSLVNALVRRNRVTSFSFSIILLVDSTAELVRCLPML